METQDHLAGARLEFNVSNPLGWDGDGRTVDLYNRMKIVSNPLG